MYVRVRVCSKNIGYKQKQKHTRATQWSTTTLTEHIDYYCTPRTHTNLNTTHSLSQNEWEHYSDALNGYLMLARFFTETRAHTIASAATATDCVRCYCFCYYYVLAIFALSCIQYLFWCIYECVRVLARKSFGYTHIAELDAIYIHCYYNVHYI